MKRTFLLLIIINTFEALHIYLRKILIPILHNTYSNNFHWGLVSYFNNYSIDFYRRSIVGTIMDLVNFPPSLNNLIFLKFIFLSIFGILFSLFFKKLNNKDFFLIALSPFFFQQFIFNSLAVNDLLTFIFFISSLLVLKTSKKNLLFILLPIGILNHLIFAICFCPLILYFLYKNKDYFFAKILTFLWFITSLFIVVYGKFNIENLQVLKNNILINGFNIDENDFYFVTETNTFFENLLFSVGYLNHVLENKVRAITFGILLVFLFFFLKIIKKEIKNFIYAFIISTLSLLLMLMIGFDYPRWIGIYISSIIIVLTYNYKTQLSKKIRFLLLISFFLGPIGTSDSFPILFKFIGLIFNP